MPAESNPRRARAREKGGREPLVGTCRSSDQHPSDQRLLGGNRRGPGWALGSRRVCRTSLAAAGPVRGGEQERRQSWGWRGRSRQEKVWGQSLLLANPTRTPHPLCRGPGTLHPPHHLQPRGNRDARPGAEPTQANTRRWDRIWQPGGFSTRAALKGNVFLER